MPHQDEAVDAELVSDRCDVTGQRLDRIVVIRRRRRPAVPAQVERHRAPILAQMCELCRPVRGASRERMHEYHGDAAFASVVDM